MTAVYLDHNATTPLDPRAREAMLPWLDEHHGNPSSIHAFGRKVADAVEVAREEIARLIGAAPPELVLTASGTEANNAVLFSVARQAGFRGHLVISAFEHPSVHAMAAGLADAGVELTLVRPGRDGLVDPGAFLGALREDTILASLMLANNEVGTLQPMEEVAAGCAARGVPVLCDAVQAVGKVPVDVALLGVDYLTLGAHKFYGPLGAAALWIRKGAPFSSYLVGGSQERRRRASTVNVPAVAGLGKAAEIARAEMASRTAHASELRDRFEAGLDGIPDAVIHCAESPRLPNTSHVAFPGADAHALMIRLDLAGYAVSTGSACSSGTVEPSRGLLAMDLPESEALASLRVSFGQTNSVAEVDAFLGLLGNEVAELRRLARTA